MGKQKKMKSAKRVNFLLQAASLGYWKIEDPQMSQSMIKSARKLVNSSQLRLHPEIKRSICKRCDNLLIPTLTSSTIDPEGKTVRQKCEVCGAYCKAIGNRKTLWNGKGFVTDHWDL
ncbi:hypothetical protein ACOME3_004600 [Neoechinorhynchus agilis]